MSETKTTKKEDKQTINSIIDDYRETHTTNETTSFIKGMLAYCKIS